MPVALIRLESRGSRATRIVLLYTAAALSWVLVGDALLAAALGVGRPIWVPYTLKGTVLVLLTGVALFRLIGGRERELASEERRLELVFGQLPGILWTTDLELSVESIVGAIEGSPLRSDQMVGRRVDEAAETPEVRALVERNHLRALDGETTDFGLHLGDRELAVRVEALRDETQRVIGTVGFALEVSPVHDKDVHSMRDALKHSRVLGALGGLTLDVAHQLKNPLFALSAALDAFEQRGGDEPATRRHRRIMRQQVERIERLVSGVQVYGRPLRLNRSPVDLTPLLHSSLRRLQPEAEAAGVLMLLRCDDGQVFASVDREAIVGAFDRVVRNAVEHAPAGSRVEVVARATGREAGGVAEVSVFDRGPGFAAAELPHLFEPLFARRTGGTGLGLAIAERIVTAHGGSISAANREDGGARVTLRLPAG